MRRSGTPSGTLSCTFFGIIDIARARALETQAITAIERP